MLELLERPSASELAMLPEVLEPVEVATLRYFLERAVPIWRHWGSDSRGASMRIVNLKRPELAMSVEAMESALNV